MSNNVVAAQELHLHTGKCGIGVSWDRVGNTIDLDLQAVVVDNKGAIIDAVYYNNLKALKSITHSGDEQTGDKAGLDEVIWVSLQKLPEHVRLVIFVVAAFSGGSLREVSNGALHVLEEKLDNEVARYGLEQTDAAVDAVAMLRRTDEGAWCLRIIEEPAREGRHFIDILEPVLGNVIRAEIPGAPRRMKVAFAMEKGSVVDLPETNAIGRIATGLGWDVSPSAGGDVDLDVSAVIFSGDCRPLGAVFFGQTEGFGLQHSGDNLTGEGDGDDEVIQADLMHVPAEAQQIFFVVNIYTNGVTFDNVSNAYCRIMDASGDEMARYVLREGRGERGLIIARLFREPGIGSGGRWGFQALGKFCRGQTWKDSVPEMDKLARMTAQQLQLRGSSYTSLDRGATVTAAQPAAAVVVAPPAPLVQEKKSSACSLM
eukprot:TRINITY_DN72882_c0_g1_i1.p1 TRINITY_DN72882_c0_g1~~TRINITY_DN72882_c0_g1_i1.p1  ORF type:complete len:428 (+),score=103.16 TRINITY_DN72882_c0_g1_i1:123-1406(+)